MGLGRRAGRWHQTFRGTGSLRCVLQGQHVLDGDAVGFVQNLTPDDFAGGFSGQHSQSVNREVAHPRTPVVALNRRLVADISNEVFRCLSGQATMLL